MVLENKRMKSIHKNKSRTRLYNAMMGTRNLVGAAGVGAVGSIQFANTAVDTEQVVLNGIYFEFDSTGEAAGTSTGTSLDPHLVDQGATVITTAANLATAMLAETTTTGAWGFFYPDDSVGCLADGVDTVDFVFWPGTAPNSYTLTGSATDETIVLPGAVTAGVVAKQISVDHAYTSIDTTGAAQNKELYTLENGSDEGDTVTVTVKTFAASSTPTILGKLSVAGVAQVEALFTTAEPGMSATFMWNGSNWEVISENARGTALTFLPSA